MKHRLVHLDCLRGLAALLVVVEHLRAFIFVPFFQLKAPGILTKGFYLVTGLGHQAVMIFFVLSGYLVGGSVISAVHSGKWSWREYLLRRMTRLWVVLIPALLLTLFWDKLGYTHATEGYEGAYREIYNSGPTASGPADWSLTSFFGNLTFLQTILVPCFGTNSPLWSLANEFWYYLLFPLLLIPFNSKSLVVRIFSLVAILAIILFLPWGILAGGLIWGLGAGVYYLIQHEPVRKIGANLSCLLLGIVLILTSLVMSRFGCCARWPWFSDSFIGFSFAILVMGLVSRGGGSGIYAKLSEWGSEISYTLYLVHFPLLACFFFVQLQGRQIRPTWEGYVYFAALMGLVSVYSFGIWWIFERNTDRIRRSIESLIV